MKSRKRSYTRRICEKLKYKEKTSLNSLYISTCKKLFFALHILYARKGLLPNVLWAAGFLGHKKAPLARGFLLF